VELDPDNADYALLPVFEIFENCIFMLKKIIKIIP
jgi:hypothetical protein